jgi:hypothetical protein
MAVPTSISQVSFDRSRLQIQKLSNLPGLGHETGRNERVDADRVNLRWTCSGIADKEVHFSIKTDAVALASEMLSAEDLPFCRVHHTTAKRRALPQLWG